MRANGLAVLGGCAAAILALGGCATTSAGHMAKGGNRIDPALVAGVSGNQLQPVTEAQSELANKLADQEGRKQEIKDAETRVKEAKADVEVSHAELDRLKSEADTAKQTRSDAEQNASADPEALIAAQRRSDAAERAVRDADARLSADNATVDYLNSLVDVAKNEQKLTDKQVDLDRAKVERARFQVLASANPEQVRALELHDADFEAEVSRREADVAGAHADLTKARAEANESYREWLAKNEGVRGTRPHPVVRAPVPPPPRV